MFVSVFGICRAVYKTRWRVTTYYIYKVTAYNIIHGDSAVTPARYFNFPPRRHGDKDPGLQGILVLESYRHVATIISTPCDIIRNTHGWSQPGAARDHHNNVCINGEMLQICSMFPVWELLFAILLGTFCSKSYESLCFQAAELHALNKIVEQQKWWIIMWCLARHWEWVEVAGQLSAEQPCWYWEEASIVCWW